MQIIVYCFSICFKQCLYFLGIEAVYTHTCTHTLWKITGKGLNCLSDLSHLYGNVMTTKASLHLHGLPVFLREDVCSSAKGTWRKQIKKFHQNVIGGGRAGEAMVAKKLFPHCAEQVRVGAEKNS